MYVTNYKSPQGYPTPILILEILEIQNTYETNGYLFIPIFYVLITIVSGITPISLTVGKICCEKSARSFYKFNRVGITYFMRNGFLNLNKPPGITAHDCVSRTRKLLGQKRVGHSGTLDPAAVGVLPIALGHATRLIRFLSGGKTYQATVRFGLRTTTDDLDGEIIAAQPCVHLAIAEIEALLPLFLGAIQQIPPAYSAIQVQGVRLYELARAGKAIEVPIRTVEVKEIAVLDWRPGEFPELDLKITCGTGTYIRAIARDLGDKLGCGATLAHLERTYSNGFDLANSLTFEAIAEQLQQSSLVLVLPEIALAHLPEASLDLEIAKRWCNGQKITMNDTVNNTELSGQQNYLRVCDNTNTFLGIAELKDQILVPTVVLPRETSTLQT